ncbi:MAG: CBS domain-containing protein [Cellvibrionaceae bacterium]
MNDDPTSSSQDRSWLDRLAQAFSGEPKTRDELESILQEAHANQLLNDEAFEIMQGALEVSEGRVEDIMVPRSQMVVVNLNDPLEEFLPKVIDSAHSRFPVIGEDLDDIRGILLAKDLLPLLLKDKHEFNLEDVLRTANVIPESKRLNTLLKEFREQRYHMAVVIDEYGNTAGIVTIEDVLEEIVGEIEDETDQDEAGNIRKLTSRQYLVQALTPIEDFNEHFDTSFSDEEFDTIGGILLQSFGHLPKRNEVTEINGMHFTVLKSDGRKMQLLRLTLPSEG